jgi:peptidoglycan/xylan/chitin deacetylase (PgdA/CDA1 family)
VKGIKYRVLWFVFIGLSFLLYFSGIVEFYVFFRKKVLKRFRTIIILYHEISDEAQSKYSVSIENFKNQMGYIKKHFNTISLNSLINNEDTSHTLMDTVAITFDDGQKDNFLNAHPVLKKYKLQATIFLISRFIGSRDDILDVEEIKTMEKDGIDFGSHTLTHKVLSEIDSNEATKEINNSKAELENILGKKIQFFAYPYGKKRHFNEYIKTQVKNAGYKAAFTTENGEIDCKSDLFELKRTCIKNFPLFVFKVSVSGIFESKFIYPIRKLCNTLVF